MTTIEETVKSAQSVMEDTKDNAAQVAGKARSALADGLHMAASTVTMLRGLGLADALGWVGLQRRRSPLLSIATFGGGFFAGAIVGILFAPMAGADTRRAIIDRALGLEKQAEQKATETATEIADKAKQAANKVGDAAAQTASSAKDAVGSTLNDAGAALTDAGNAVKRAPDPETSRTRPGGHHVS